MPQAVLIRSKNARSVSVTEVTMDPECRSQLRQDSVFICRMFLCVCVQGVKSDISLDTGQVLSHRPKSSKLSVG